MSASDISAVEAALPTLVEAPGTTAEPPRSGKARWPYTLALAVITVVVLIPVIVTVVLSFQPQLSSTSHSVFTLENFTYIFAHTQVLTWLRNSLIATVATCCPAAAAGRSAVTR
jgi:multiple sugar transport system permease protein